MCSLFIFFQRFVFSVLLQNMWATSKKSGDWSKGKGYVMVYIPFNQTCHTILEKKNPTNTDFIRKNPFLHDQTVWRLRWFKGRILIALPFCKRTFSVKKITSAKVLTAGCEARNPRISPNGTLWCFFFFRKAFFRRVLRWSHGTNFHWEPIVNHSELICSKNDVGKWEFSRKPFDSKCRSFFFKFQEINKFSQTA